MLGGERVGGVNSSEDARHCSVLYICKYFVDIQIESPSKNRKRNLYFYCFVTPLLFFVSLKSDVNVPSKSKKQKKLIIIFFVGVLKVTDEKSRSWIH
jgi:hypothetical protein